MYLLNEGVSPGIIKSPAHKSKVLCLLNKRSSPETRLGRKSIELGISGGTFVPRILKKYWVKMYPLNEGVSPGTIKSCVHKSKVLCLLNKRSSPETRLGRKSIELVISGGSFVPRILKKSWVKMYPLNERRSPGTIKSRANKSKICIRRTSLRY